MKKGFISIDYLLVILLFLCFMPCSAFAQKSDVVGSSDHPLISRFDGFWIGEYSQVDFDSYKLPLGPAVNNKTLGEHLELEGKVTKIFYQDNVDPFPSAYQIFKNYETALKAQGAEILFSCQKGECGKGATDFFTNFSDNDVFLSYYMRFGTHAYHAATFASGGKRYHVGIFIREENNLAQYELHIVESDEISLDKVTVADITKGIEETGRQVFYGIYFDFGKSTLKPESQESLEQVAAYLKDNPDKPYYVVGHTDNVGAYGSNVELSQARAKSVVNALQRMGINTDRLMSVGVGPVAPVRPNDTDSNRALNRRVELVAQ
ncbi:MAG: OmpA family protein [Bacteroidota bacterium]